MISPVIILSVLVLYFGLLYLISVWRTRGADEDSFYLSGRKNSWVVISYGMVGVAISGITFISVPGQVATLQFSYFQLVIGFVIGLLLVAYYLLPVFYRENSPSIYAYLEDRFGTVTHKTGVIFFMIAHLVGAAFRLYLMAFVLQYIFFDRVGVPFWATVMVTLFLIWLYTYKSGIRTVIITDTLQTTFLLAAVLFAIFSIAKTLNLSLLGLSAAMNERELTQTFFWSWESPRQVLKLVFTGAMLTFMNNGLDQAIMQKHLSCPDLSTSRKNILLLCGILLVVNFLFLFLGGALVVFAEARGLPMPDRTDQLFPMLAMEHLGPAVGILFILGIAAAAYSSADSSLTGLTTSFCIDLLRFHKGRESDPKVRARVHFLFSVALFILILVFHAVNDRSVVDAFLRVTGYVYGPLFGLFMFGLLVRGRPVRDPWTPVVCLAAPLLSLVLDRYDAHWFNGFQFGHGIMVVNGLLSFSGIWLLSLNLKRPQLS